MTHPDILELDYEGFVIDSAQKAEWALKKIAKIDKEYKIYSDVCRKEIDFYIEKAEEAKNKRDIERSNLVRMLEHYFESVDSKVTKTQATYKLPSGKLIRKLEKRELKHDPVKLLVLLSNTEFVELKPSLKWGEYKKTLQIASGKVVDQNGEIVEGVTVEIKPASFDVEVDAS